jgi:hypothetical protein
MYDTGLIEGVALAEIRRTLTTLARDLEPSTVALSEAKAMLGELVAVKNIATALQGRLARRIADAREWERAGYATPEAWLAQRTGTPLGKAKETLTTAERLEHLPAVAEAAEAGELSAEQTAMIADAASADPSAQHRLVDSARNKPLSQLRDECAATKRAADPDPEAAHRRLWAARQLQFSRALEGAARLVGATTPEQMAVIKAAVERRGNQLFDQARKDGRREPREAYLMDALAQICDEWLRGRAGDLFDPKPATAPSGETDNPRRRRVPPGYLGLLRLDVEALQRGRVHGNETCEIAGVGPIPVSVARRLLGDAVLKLVLTKGNDVLNVTHLGRGPTTAQKVAMLWNSPGCVITACPRMAGIEHDHRIDWAHTHHTTLPELDRLCTHHHHLKTNRAWALIRDADGTVEMVPPSDPRHPAAAVRQRDGPAQRMGSRPSQSRAASATMA